MFVFELHHARLRRELFHFLTITTAVLTVFNFNCVNFASAKTLSTAAFSHDLELRLERLDFREPVKQNFVHH